MHRETHNWFSSHLGQEMTLNVYGHGGAPVLVFPTSRGRYMDYEGMGMIDAVADFIERRLVRLFCVDSVDAQSWYRFDRPPAERNARHEAYERYILNEVVAFVRNHCGRPEARVMASGCSMGAYHAVNFFLKHPDVFAGTIALSGLYRLDREEFGLGAQDLAAVYFNSPLAYLPGLADNWYLDRCRAGRMIVCVGQGAWEDEALADTRQLEAVCHDKAIAAQFDYWGRDVDHDWPWWQRQMAYFLEQLYG